MSCSVSESFSSHSTNLNWHIGQNTGKASMENFVSNLRSFAMDTYRTSIEAVNTLELGVVPFISRHFVLPADVDTISQLFKELQGSNLEFKLNSE